MGIEEIGLAVKLYTILLSIVAGVAATKKIAQLWRTRHLRKIWGIKNGDAVTVVCSELEDPDHRQHVEPREFIYNLKYGDVDAYFEVVVTLLRLYPKVRLRVMSCGEIEQTRFDVAGHLILIGGPDYNGMTDRVLDWGTTQFTYRIPETAYQSPQFPEEIVLYDKVHNTEYCHQIETKDYGYFERIVNKHNPEKHIILVGGCHTIGVTAAVKAFSMAESEFGEIPSYVLRNAALVAKKIKKARSFSVLVSADLIGQTISCPVVKENDVTVGVDQITTGEPTVSTAQT